MELYLLRHGEAGKSSAGPGDSRRALTEEGKKQSGNAGEALVSLGVTPDRILSSPLRRCVETAEAVAKKLGAKQAVEHWDELSPEGDARAFLRRLAEFGPESAILAVGHEPYLSSLAADLTGARGARLVLKKSGLVRIHVLTLGASPRGELRWLLSPRVLKRLS